MPDRAWAQAKPRGLLPFGFSGRFFLLLGIGFIFLIPAWWSMRLVGLMWIWDALVVFAWLLDLARLPRPSAWSVARSFTSPLALGRRSTVNLEVACERPGVTVFCQDAPPAQICPNPPVLNGWSVSYDVLPRERGALLFGRTFLRYRTALGLAERWAVADTTQSVAVYPDLVSAAETTLYLIQMRRQQVEKRQQRFRGLGRQFESLREYRNGDEFRDISWTATARRRQLITRTYTIEASQTVWIIVDSGRLMRARVASGDFRFSKLDHAVNAALTLAQVAEANGDRVGVLAYGRKIEAVSAPSRGAHHIRHIVESLAKVKSEPVEADHGLAASNILYRQTRRALVIWLTDFAETPALPDVIEYAVHVSKRHLVLFGALSQPDLKDLAHSLPANEDEMYRQAAALEITDRRELLLRKLRQSGVLAVDLQPGHFTSELVNRYLEVKDRSLW